MDRAELHEAWMDCCIFLAFSVLLYSFSIVLPCKGHAHAASHGCSSVVVLENFRFVGNHGLQDVGPGIAVQVKHMLTVGYNKPKQSQIVRKRKTDLCHLLRFDKLNARNGIAERKKKKT